MNVISFPWSKNIVCNLRKYCVYGEISFEDLLQTLAIWFMRNNVCEGEIICVCLE